MTWRLCLILYNRISKNFWYLIKVRIVKFLLYVKIDVIEVNVTYWQFGCTFEVLLYFDFLHERLRSGGSNVDTIHNFCREDKTVGRMWSLEELPKTWNLYVVCDLDPLEWLDVYKDKKWQEVVDGLVLKIKGWVSDGLFKIMFSLDYRYSCVNRFSLNLELKHLGQTIDVW